MVIKVDRLWRGNRHENKDDSQTSLVSLSLPVFVCPANNLVFFIIQNLLVFFRWEISPSITTSSSSSLSLSSPGLATIVPLQKSSSRRTTTLSSTWKTCQQRPWRRRRSTAASCKVDLLAGERVQSTSYLRRSTRRRCFLITVPESSISCPRR